MNLLIVAATVPEVFPLINYFKGKEINKNRLYNGKLTDGNIEFLITGVGMVATTYQLTKHLNLNKYDLAINVGIAGSFKKEIIIGEIVNVIEDSFYEMGAEDGEKFIPISNLNIDATNNSTIINPHKSLNENISKLKKVKGITVNKVHGSEKSISDVLNRMNPDVETMEGASFMYVCSKENINYIQLRAISNYIEKRNKQNWDINLAIVQINNFLLNWLK